VTKEYIAGEEEAYKNEMTTSVKKQRENTGTNQQSTMFAKTGTFSSGAAWTGSAFGMNRTIAAEPGKRVHCGGRRSEQNNMTKKNDG
jgi:hypothetical protein